MGLELIKQLVERVRQLVIRQLILGHMRCLMEHIMEHIMGHILIEIRTLGILN